MGVEVSGVDSEGRAVDMEVINYDTTKLGKWYVRFYYVDESTEAFFGFDTERVDNS